MPIVAHSPTTLTTTLAYQHAHTLMAPAYDALPDSECRRLQRTVERLARAGKLDQARALVADEIRLICLSREITRHLTDGGCPVCADGGELYCLDLERMDRIEAGIAARVAQAGGGI